MVDSYDRYIGENIGENIGLPWRTSSSTRTRPGRTARSRSTRAAQDTDQMYFTLEIFFRKQYA